MGRTAQPASTSGEYLWKQTKRKVKPARVREINFQRPKSQLTAVPAKVRRFSSSARGMYQYRLLVDFRLYFFIPFLSSEKHVSPDVYFECL